MLWLVFTYGVKCEFYACFVSATLTSRGVIPSPPGIAWPGCLTTPHSERSTLIAWSVSPVWYTNQTYIPKGSGHFGSMYVTNNSLLVLTDLAYSKGHFFSPHCYGYADPCEMQLPCSRPRWKTHDLPWWSFWYEMERYISGCKLLILILSLSDSGAYVVQNSRWVQ